MAGVISVEIGELVLYGFPPAERHRIAESVASGLAARFGGGPVPEQPRTISEQIAQAVYEAVLHA